LLPAAQQILRTIETQLLGAIAGGAIGANLDRQEAALRSQLGGSGALIQNTGDQLIVTLPESITFDLNSSAVKPRFQGTLSQFAANLQEFPNSRVSMGLIRAGSRLLVRANSPPSLPTPPLMGVNRTVVWSLRSRQPANISNNTAGVAFRCACRYFAPRP